MNLAGFSDLPDEVVLHIFSFLSVHVVRCVLPRVNRAWGELARHPALWRTLEVKVEGKSGNCPAGWPAPLAFLRATPEVRDIRCGFTWRADQITEILRHLLPYNKVRRLVLARSLKREHLSVLNPYLEELHVDELPNTDDFSALRRLSELRKLQVFDINANVLAALLPHVPNLTELKITGRIMGKLDMATLKLMHNLKELTLDLGQLDPLTLAEMAKFPQLRRFSAVDITPTLPKLLGLGKLPLMHLRLAEPFLSPVLPSAALVTFFSSCIFSSLRRLQLLDSRLNDTGACVLRTNCPSLRSLEVEKLPANDAADELTELGLKHLLHLQNLHSLEVRVRIGHDWFYQRRRWGSHTCDTSLPCPAGLEALLHDWEEYCPIVV